MASACHPQCTKHFFTLPSNKVQRVFVKGFPVSCFLSSVRHSPQPKHVVKQGAVRRNLLYLDARRGFFDGGGANGSSLQKGGDKSTQPSELTRNG